MSELGFDARPAWAIDAHLPRYDALRYVQQLAVTIALVAVAVYLASRAAKDPKAIGKALRKRAGV